MKPVPKLGMILIAATTLALYTGLAVWGWGGWRYGSVGEGRMRGRVV